ncbi:hypothetical protein FIBSPDRAFT_837244 [Athelia psychrophila]|uniref:Uncharacterized protein n=1 Tax=Athelia psychrophila TaxID=1759441 RepID=A0A166AKZ7_9AGAM|nr:hypothetical protein FIBSPDRAFT_837244 [Fibularhizoctonia sp. CBS 109695]
MRLALLLVSLSLLQGCIAPAISNDIATANCASPIPDTASSLASSNPAFDTCNDLRTCRSLVGIVASCLATIFACVWVAVHPNVPGPNQTRKSRYFESFKLVGVTLLVPEWVLAWAVRQFLQATDQSKLTLNNYHSLCLFTAWTMTHGFLMIMGGFHSYRGGQPMFPLDAGSVLALVRSRSLVPPTSGELGDRSKGDALSKTIAILQTFWFVAQCIARHVENLAITNLEIVTLAYTAITVAMYAAWWHKPLKVQYPVRVKGDREFVKNTLPFHWVFIIAYVTGNQDQLITLSDEEQVPTFWSNCTSDLLILFGDIIALMVAMVFGAVHCAAWSYTFPSLEQQKMWRVCAIAIAAIPLPMAGAFAVYNPITSAPRKYFEYTIAFFMALRALLYIVARLLLLILSLTTLHNLPLSAHQTV